MPPKHDSAETIKDLLKDETSDYADDVLDKNNELKEEYEEYIDNKYDRVYINVLDVPSDVPANPAWLRDEPQVQIFCRGPRRSYKKTWKRAEMIKQVLLGAYPRNINDENVFYAAFRMSGDLHLLEVDDEERPRVVATYQLVREYEKGYNRLPL